MKKLVLFLFFLITFLATGCNQTPEIERGREAWVFRSVLDLKPRMVTAGLRKDFWVSYDGETGALYKVWRDGVDLAGAVFDGRHGPQPIALGPAYLIETNRMPLQLMQNGDTLKTDIQYKGHRFEDNRVIFKYILTTEDGTQVTIQESPEFIEGQTNKPGLERKITTENVPANTTVALAINITSLDENGFSTDGTLQESAKDSTSLAGTVSLKANDVTTLTTIFNGNPSIWPQIEKTEEEKAAGENPAIALMAETDCATCHNQDVQTVGPSYREIAARYPYTPSTVTTISKKIREGGSGAWGEAVMTPHPQLRETAIDSMVHYILSLDGEAMSVDYLDVGVPSIPLISKEKTDANQGIAVNVYQFAKMEGFPELTENDIPSQSGVATAIHAVKDEDFEGLDENFYVEFTGFINIDKSDNYLFRTVSDDGSLLEIDGKVVVDNDGFHGPDPKDGETFLTEGAHPFRMKFFEAGGGQAVSLQWLKRGTENFEIVPPEVFTYDANDLKETQPYVPPTETVVGVPGDGRSLVDVHPDYKLDTIRPSWFQPKIGGLDVLEDGRVIVSTWDSLGAVYILSNLENGDPEKIEVKKIAEGLAEPLGLKVVDGTIYVLQKQELTKLIDHNGDEVIDEYETVSNDWKVSANFHEFAFGLVYQNENFYATLAIAIMPGGASAQPQIPDRGKVMRINRNTGEVTFLAQGLRTPNGIGIGVDNEIFVADNQGDWLPSSKILHVQEGAFYNGRAVDFEGTATLPITQPVVWLPQDEIGNSPSQPALITEGVFKGQMMHGEVTHGGLKRVFVEKVDGNYQGAVFRFTQGLEAGINRTIVASDGRIYVGGVGNPGNWGHAGKEWYGLQRLTYEKPSSFEMLAVSARSNGFEIEMTEPLESTDGFNPDEYEVQQWRYVPTIEYGGPKVDVETLKIEEVSISNDRRKIGLKINGLKPEHVVYIRLKGGWVSSNNHPLWSTEAWYTLNTIPEEAPVFANEIQNKPTVNTLTQEERAVGWELLFDGKDIATNWHTFLKDKPGNSWQIDKDAIHLTGEPADGDWKVRDGGDLVSAKEYENFELKLEWRLEEGGNSGVLFNVVEKDTYKDTYQTGPEMQVLDNERHADGAIQKHRAGDLYDLKEVDFITVKQPREWNKVRIKLVDGKGEFWLNGYKVVSFEQGSDEWNEMIQNSKFSKHKNFVDFGKATKGHLALQDHGDPVWFRNIKIRKL